MKLAEALQERADLNRRIDQLSARLTDNALVQEGEKTAEDPRELLAELDGCLLRLEELMAKINLTNARTVSDGRTITELIARRDTLRLRREHYRRLISAGSQSAQRARSTEIRILPAVDVKALQKTADAMAKEFRELDNRIQQLNWSTELSD